MEREQLGAVVIGRNEGQRLQVCLRSLAGHVPHVVYVDSGSSDDSVAHAQSLGAQVVQLDMGAPFTAARARNAGFERLQALAPDLRFVQFVDGDCELQPGWLEVGADFLSRSPDVAVVCGRLRERYPSHSPYNRLCDMEWDTPVGEALSCGGIALFRRSAFEESGGFAPALIAGEEPDLCFRLRREGWRVVRLDAEMALHDAAMKQARQWWRRSVRSGYAVAEASHRRGAFEPLLNRQVWSNVVWALPPAWLLWPLLWWRVYRRRGALYATHIVLGKIPHLVGQLRFWLNRHRGTRAELIEYK